MAILTPFLSIISRLIIFLLFRVKTVLRTSSGDVSSVLSIKSAILDDGGNYTCAHVEHDDSSDTVRIIVVDGELGKEFRWYLSY